MGVLGKDSRRLRLKSGYLGEELIQSHFRLELATKQRVSR